MSYGVMAQLYLRGKGDKCRIQNSEIYRVILGKEYNALVCLATLCAGHPKGFLLWKIPKIC